MKNSFLILIIFSIIYSSSYLINAKKHKNKRETTKGGSTNGTNKNNNNDFKDYAALQLDTWRSQNNPANILTASNGMPVPSLTDSLTVGPRGPTLLQDFVLLDNLLHFSRERIAERVVHARGAGAFGVFKVTNDVTKYTKMDMLKQVGKETPCFFRFSTVGGRSGSADTARDPRGFAMKYYTEEGNFDLVGNNQEVFFIRDAMLFPSFVHTQKTNPVTNLPDPNAMWDFFSLRTETMAMIMRVFSDRGTPDGFRKMDGFGTHTYELENSKGEITFCKFHLKTQQGIHNLTAEQATLIAGMDPEYSTKDLWNAIAIGDFPKWDMKIQVMTVEQSKKVNFNIFDTTKIWPIKDYPLIDVGTVTLNKNPENFFQDVEQAAFDPARTVPGVGPARGDKLLQGRLLSYQDAQFYRLGANHMLIPVNCPYKFRYSNIQRDGLDRPDKNGGGVPNYFPNSFGGYKIAGVQNNIDLDNATIGRFKQSDDDNFVQPADFWKNELDDIGRQHLVENIAGSLGNTLKEIQDRMIPIFKKVDQIFGSMIEKALAKKPG